MPLSTTPRRQPVIWAGEQQFCLVCVVADVKDAALELIDRWRHFVVSEVQVQLCVVRVGVKRHAVLDSPVRKVRHVQDEEQQTKD